MDKLGVRVSERMYAGSCGSQATLFFKTDFLVDLELSQVGGAGWQRDSGDPPDPSSAVD